ncbi:sigma-70 family RNA polymerase sigma factor [Flagellimonas olearia]|uniref:Sigma-70 family RNA polymerase sigma factor n=1 Tax=Flagellimonas olearia TaxID=552546 RepID=A0A6I1DWK7_9FLAO|nr:sigma-70 family RNA polymerase sigma factor [Allomuricauda olearia]KAB7529568.1 sigma-70 family RNA polymerase sigma factor [Allomuricauda olearia]
MLTAKERKLIRSIRKGNTRAFSELVNRYKDLVYTLALRMLGNREEAEEVSQDTFIKVFHSLERFKGDSKISTWIYRIAYNACLDRIRLRKSRTFLDVGEMEDFVFTEMDTALDKMVREERGRLVGQCLAKLPSEDAGLLTLFYFEEKSLLEIENILNVPVNSLKVRLFRARKKLAAVLEAHLKQEILQNNG